MESPDLLELAFTIEEQFGMRLKDRDAEHIMTMGQLQSYILEKQGKRITEFCASSRVFYRLRQALIQGFGAQRCHITTAAAMTALLPRKSRAQHWERLGALLGGWDMPRLEPGLRTLLVPLLCLMGLILPTLVFPRQSHLGFAIFLVALLSTPLAMWLFVLRPYKNPTIIPWSCATVGGAVKALLRQNYGRLLTETGRFQETNEVWQKLCDIVTQWGGVNRGVLTPATRFDKDPREW
jgi:hypothetical protein